MKSSKSLLFFGVGIIVGFGVAALFTNALTGNKKEPVSVLAEIASDPDMVAYNYEIVDNDEGISYDGMTAVLEDSTRLNVYFRTENGASIETYTDFTVDGVPTSPVLANDGSYYVTVTDIAAKELGNPHVITVGGLTISNISAITYVYRVSISPSPSEKSIALVESLYGYYKAAETYFCSEHDYVSEVVAEAAGCKPGVVKHICQKCGGKYWDTLNHSEGLIFTLNASKTGYNVSGYTGDGLNIVIPSTYKELPVTTIDASAFENDNVISVILPNSVTAIEENAFCGCAALENVYYTGTTEEWNGISVDIGNDRLTRACFIYSEKQPTEAGRYWHYEKGVPTTWSENNTVSIEITVLSMEEAQCIFKPSRSGNYIVSCDNKGINNNDIIISHNNTNELWTNAVALTAGENYKITVVNRTGENLTVSLTIELVE